MATNQLALLAVQHGIDPPAMRRVLRLFHDWLVDVNTPGRKLGVEQFGVFYSQDQPERFVVRDGKVFHRPACRVVKLRPAKQQVQLVETLPVLDIELNISGFGDVSFTLLSGATYWTHTNPDPLKPNEYYLVRSDSTPRRYAIIRADLNPQDVFAAQQDMGITPGGPWIEFIRWDSMFLGLPGVSSVNDYFVFSQVFVASPIFGDPGTPEELYEPGLNRFVLARFRAKTIGIADFP